MFQMTFAIITPALIVGAYVERIKFSAVLVFSGLWLIVVYAPVAHWVWGGGWLAQRACSDFAGGIVVHTTAGVSALVDRRGARPAPGLSRIRCGRRTRRGSSWSAPSMLWVGWFGFNAGSALDRGRGRRHGDAGDAPLRGGRLARLDGHRVACASESRASSALVTGTIAGLATITPASGYRRSGGRHRHRHCRRLALLRRGATS